MSIRKIIKEELDGFKNSTEEDWELWFGGTWGEGVEHTVREWLNDKELLDFLVKVYRNTNEDNILRLSGDISYNPNNSSQIIRLINEPINILEIWPNVSRTAHTVERKSGDNTKGLLIIEFTNGVPPELKRRSKLEGKPLGYDDTILLGSSFSDYNLILSY